MEGESLARLRHWSIEDPPSIPQRRRIVVGALWKAACIVCPRQRVLAATPLPGSDHPTRWCGHRP
jgi:hypothetical protein